VDAQHDIAESLPKIARRARGASRAASAVAAALVALTVGCGGSEVARLSDYLDDVEFDAPLESAAYVSLGRYDVPAPMAVKPAEGGARTVWVRLSFELFAETAPDDEQAVAAAAQRHRGAINDSLLSIIRTSSTDELTDPRLGALKLRMTEATRPLLGERKLRQLWLDDIDNLPM
jgi:hypothetical protein